MNFDLTWFTEIPGILVTIGIVLLIVALILLVVTGKRSKKETNADGTPVEKG